MGGDVAPGGRQGGGERVDEGEAAAAARGGVDDEMDHVRGCYRTDG